MDNDDELLITARNAKEPVFPFDIELLGKSVDKLKQAITRQHGLLKQVHSAREGAEYRRIIKSCQYHMKINNAVTGLFDERLNPLRRAGGKWADRSYQQQVIKVVRALFKVRT